MTDLFTDITTVSRYSTPRAASYVRSARTAPWRAVSTTLGASPRTPLASSTSATRRITAFRYCKSSAPRGAAKGPFPRPQPDWVRTFFPVQGVTPPPKMVDPSPTSTAGGKPQTIHREEKIRKKISGATHTSICKQFWTPFAGGCCGRHIMQNITPDSNHGGS